MGLETLTKRAKQIINDTLYLSLATSNNNETWIAPLWYAVDNDYNFYFVSETSSKHTHHIQANNQVAFSIFNSQESPETVNGLQKGKIGAKSEVATLPTQH